MDKICSKCKEFGPAYENDSYCIKCRKLYSAAWNQRQKEKGQEFVEGHKSTKTTVSRETKRRGHKEYYQKNRQRIREYQYLTKYGLTLQEIRDHLNEINFLCPCCKTEMRIDGKIGKNKAVVDHNHDTGEIRGILCSRCNVIVGNCEENPEILKNIVDYINGNLRWERQLRFEL